MTRHLQLLPKTLVLSNALKVAKIFSVTKCLIVAAISPSLAQAISVDGTTPTKLNNGNSCASTCNITGGLRDSEGSGPNIFHSFSTFNINNGATVTFSDPGVDNIFSRVTGSSISYLDGRLKVDGNANLFLLNPNGIIFEDDASIDIPGSFLASTAESINFQNSAKFSATTSALPSLLTINVPLGLQFGESFSRIEVQGDGSNNLAYNPNNTINRTEPDTGLIASNGQTLALLGGDINIPGGSITAEAGHIELGALSGNSLVQLTSTPTASTAASIWNFDYSEATGFKDIELSNRAALDISGDDAGSIRLQGEDISLSGGSSIVAKVLNHGSGHVMLNAFNSLNFLGIELSATQPMLTGVFAEISPGATGDGGSQLVLNADTINVTAGAQVGLGMGGYGKAGKVVVNAQTITADNGSNVGPSSIYSAVLPVFDGDPETDAEPDQVTGVDPDSNANGQGGNLWITTDQLNITNGAQVTVSTFGPGNAGNLTVNAKNIKVVGNNFDEAGNGGGSSIRAASELPGSPFTPLPKGSGTAGDITINTERLFVADLGQVLVATASDRAAGNLAINASDAIELKDGDESGRSGLFANSVLGSGPGGSINVTTNQLSILEGATINVSSASSVVSFLTATGPAGNIDIDATGTVEVKDGGVITADTAAGGGANIKIKSDSLVLRREGNITTDANGTATGGNINIDTAALIAFENSDITANAEESSGGRIIVSAPTIYGTAYREQATPASDITATSDLGPAFSGSVEINSPEVDPTEGITELPEGLDSEQQVTAACEKIDANTFVASGRGGLPQGSSQLVTGQSIWNDFRLLQDDSVYTTKGEGVEQSDVVAIAPNTLEMTHPVVEAQGWIVNNKGEVVLGVPTPSPISLDQAISCLTS